MKSIEFIGSSLKSLREFPEAAKHDAGYQLDKVQHGERADDCKHMPAIGKGVEEIRLWDQIGTYRVIYTAKWRDIIYVLHAFQKKSEVTDKADIALAKARFKTLR